MSINQYNTIMLCSRGQYRLCYKMVILNCDILLIIQIILHLKIIIELKSVLGTVPFKYKEQAIYGRVYIDCNEHEITLCIWTLGLATTNQCQNSYIYDGLMI